VSRVESVVEPFPTGSSILQMDAAGVVEGSTDFQFDIFNVAGGGTALVPTVSKSGVNVTHGLFTVELDFGA